LQGFQSEIRNPKSEIERGSRMRWCSLFIISLILSFSLAASAGTEAEFDFAKSLYKDGMYGAAARQFEQFVRDHPASERAAAAQFLAAGAHFWSGAMEEALSGYERFIVRHPDDLRIPEARMKRGACLSELGRFADAAEVFSDLRKLFPTGDFADRALLEAGRNFLRIGDPERAIGVLSAIIHDYPQSKHLAAARYVLGLCLKDQGRLEEALSQLEQATSVGARFDQKADALRIIGRIYLIQGDVGRAEAMFQRLNEVFRDRAVTAQFAVELGHSLSEKGRFEEASQLFERAIALPASADSTRAAARLGWAHADHRAGKEASAVFHYRTFLSEYPSDRRGAEAISGLTDALLSLGDESDALSVSRELFQTYPGSEHTLSTLRRLGDFYAQKEDPLRAVSYYRRFLSSRENLKTVEKPTRIGRESPTHPLTHAPHRGTVGGEEEGVQFALAEVYEKLRWHDQAAVVYRDILVAQSHESDRAQFALARGLEKEGRTEAAARAYRSVVERFPESYYAPESAVKMELLRDFMSPDYSAATERLSRIISEVLAKGAPEGETLYELGLVQYEALNGFQEATRLFSASLAATDTMRAPDAIFMLAQSHGRLARRSALTGDSSKAAMYREQQAEAYRKLIAKTPKSATAAAAALFLIEESFSKSEPDFERYAGMLRAYEQFIGDYPTSDRMDFVLLRIGDAYRGLARTDSSAVHRAISWYEKLPRQFPDSPYRDDACFGRGMVYKEAGALSEAEAAFQTLLSDYPHSDRTAQAHLRLGENYMERGAFDQAVAAFEAYSDCGLRIADCGLPHSPITSHQSPITSPDSIRALMAEAFYRKGSFSKAIPLYEQQLRTAGDEDRKAAILLRLVEMYERVGEPERAIERATQCIARYPESAASVSCLLARADLFRRTEHPEEALSDYRALASSRFASKASKSRADLLFALERYEEASKAYESLLGSSPEDADAAGTHVLCLFRLGRSREATQAVRSFRKRFGDARNWLARLELEQGKRLLGRKEFEAAQASFEKQLNAFGDTEYADDARYYLGLVHFQQKRMEEALQVFSDFLTAFPKSPFLPEVTMKLGTIYYLSGHFASAIDYYKTVSKSADSGLEVDALFNMVLSYERLGRYDAAIEIAETLIRRFPENDVIPRVKMKKGISLMKLGNYEKAIAVFQKNMPGADAETKAALRFYIGQCRAMSGNYEQAVIEYLKVAYLHRSQAMWAVTAEYEAAKVYEKLNRLSEAEKLYQRIIARYGPESEWAQAAEKRLKTLRPKGKP
jgi:TolA-binding protein